MARVDDRRVSDRRPTASLLILLPLVAIACGDADADDGSGGASTSASVSSASATATSSTTSSATSSTSATTAPTTATTTATSATTAATGTGGAGPLPGYGALAGACGEIDLDDVDSPDPEILENAIDFTGRPMVDVSLLSPGGQTMYAAGNLNQSSLWSEVFAYEVLYRCDDAVFLKGEADIVYAVNGKKTDLLVEIDGKKVGVSVVRAVSFPEGSPYPVDQAYGVLEGKLADILQSSANVAAEDAWEKQILAVVAQTPDHAQAIVDAWAMVPAATKADTIVLVTVTEGDDSFVYYAN